MKLKDKIALVTGSTTGIGEAIARCFSSEGAKIMLHGLPGPEGQRIAGELNIERPGTAAFRHGDLADPAECEALISAAVAQFGGLDILVNNAAVTTRSSLETTDAELFNQVIAVNLRAPLLLIRAALPHFRRAGGGRVLNIGSVNAYCGAENLLAYSVSKGGLMTLSRNLADAHGHEGIRVNHFNVGWVLTPNEFQQKLKDGLPPNWVETIVPQLLPSGRLLTPVEIAHFALMFVCEEAALINGAVVDLEQHPMIGRNSAKKVT